MGQRRRVGRSLGQRSVEPHDVDLLAVVVAVEAGVLQVEAELEDVLAGPVSFEMRQRFDQLQAVDVALLPVEEVAALPLRRIDHRQRRPGSSDRPRTCGRPASISSTALRREDQPIDRRPAEKPDCVNVGVVSGGRNVDSVALVILRGK